MSRHAILRRKTFLGRDGATAVEFALVAPLVILFVFCGVMFFGVLMTQNTLTAAARAGGRVASRPYVTSTATVNTAVQDRLQQAGVRGAGGGAHRILSELVTAPASPRA